MPLQGHAVEARIYAEDPARGFLPSTGTLLALQFPDGVRVDTGVEQGSAITPYYDPMIAKMIAHAPTREAALDKLAAALEQHRRGRPAYQPGAARGALPCGGIPRRDNSTPASSTATWRRSAAASARSRGGGVRRGAVCWRGILARIGADLDRDARRAGFALGCDRRISSFPAPAR